MDCADFDYHAPRLRWYGGLARSLNALYTGLPWAGGTYIPGAVATHPRQTQFALASGQSMTVPVSVTLTPGPLPPKVPNQAGVHALSSYYLLSLKVPRDILTPRLGTYDDTVA
jgi:hypothetical protein